MAVTIYLGETTDTSFASVGMMPMPYAKPLWATGFLGTVKTVIT
jgi:hypothetical protein